VRGKRILILGGTREARELAALLSDQGALPVTSLAGVTQEPAHPKGAMRTGGFGGIVGLMAYLEREHFDAIVDAAHPFAAQISKHAAEAASRCRMPIARLERPPWRPEPRDNWHFFPDVNSAAAAIPNDSRVMLTVGRKEISPFLSRPGLTGIARMIEAPTTAVPAGWTILRARPPFTLADERALIDRERITVVVAKNSGGEDTRAKLDAARESGLAVYLIERPFKPAVPIVSTPAAALALLADLVRS